MVRSILLILLVSSFSSYADDHQSLLGHYLFHSPEKIVEYKKFQSISSNLFRSFDDICGDTYCEGDYSQIESVKFDCIVDTQTNIIKSCNWIFLGLSTIDNLEFDAKPFQCKFDVNQSYERFLNDLGDLPIEKILEHRFSTQGFSIYEALGNCLI